MYSEEYRLRVVGEFRASGLRYREACDRFPHFPNAKTLTRWDRDFAARGVDVPLPERAPAERRKHSRARPGVKERALRMLARGASAREVGARLGFATGTVSQWARAARGAGTMPCGKGAVAVRRDGELEALRAERDRLELENRVLRELMRDPKAGDPASLSNRQKAELGERLRAGYGYSLGQVTTCLHISRSTYEYQRRALARPPKDAELADRVARDFAGSGMRYGYRRIHAQISGGLDGGPALRVSEKRVRAAMRSRGLRPVRARRARRYDSYGGETDARPANLPREMAEARRASDPGFAADHDFSAPRPGELAVTDVTEFALGGFKCYLSPVLDCFDGMPASWSVSRHPDSALCESSLRSYLRGLPEGHGPLAVHSDGGACYRTASWKALCEGAGAARSMSRKGCCPDNARAEGFFGALKEEFFYGREWAGVTYEGFASALDSYIRWYRDGRLKAFRGPDGRVRYETISGRRRRLGLTV